MPIVTSVRDIPSEVPNSQYYAFGGPRLTEPSIVWPGTHQETTSYRSRRKDDDAGGEYSRLSGPELARNLRAEYQTRFDNGHEFFTKKTSAEVAFPSVELFGVNFNYGYDFRYVGPFFPTPFAIDSYPNEQAPLSNSEISSIGRQMIAHTAPTAPEAGLAAFLGEAREKLPTPTGAHSLFERGSVSSKIGHEHLNLTFGLKPFISDIQKMAQAVKHAHSLIEQFKRGSDKNIRRKRSLDPTESAVFIGNDSLKLSLPRETGQQVVAGNIYSSYPQVEVWDRYYRQISFAGAFTYHLSEAHDFLGKMDQYLQKADYLLGTDFTPDTFWQLTPWSWLVDWETDLGTFFKNVSLLSSDSLVLRYGYLMVHSKATRERTFHGAIPWRDAPTASSLSVTTETKTRTRATPYGFGLDTSAFTPQKWAILGALGLTKGDKNLRYIG